MADDKNDKGFNPIKWFIENPEWLLIGWYAVKGAVSGHVDDDAPDTAKSAAKAAGASTGGKHRPEDEAAWRRVKNKIGTDVNHVLLADTLDKLVSGVFDQEHKSKWRRDQGEDSFGEWRTQIAQAAKDDLDDAVLYLTRLAEKSFYIFEEECIERKETPLSIKGNETAETYAWRATCKRMRKQMQSDAVPLPKGIKPYGVRLKEAVSKTGPEAIKQKIPAGWKKTKDWWKCDEFTAKRKAANDRIINSAKDTIHQTRETAAAHADWMEQQAIERKKQDDALGRFDRFLNKILPF
jgi:hypothetical protein